MRRRTEQPRRHLRLDLPAYAQVSLVCSITIATRHRAAVFSNPDVAQAAVEVLRQLAADTEVVVYAYCVMPDHVHLLLSPSPSCDLITFVGQFKNLAQRAAWQRGVNGSFWQRRFWDHFVRSDEGLERTVAYVLNNPVRAGFVQQWGDYPYSGSLVFEP
jgi:putative transposase